LLVLSELKNPRRLEAGAPLGNLGGQQESGRVKQVGSLRDNPVTEWAGSTPVKPYNAVE